jgi:hypothetical protein
MILHLVGNNKTFKKTSYDMEINNYVKCHFVILQINMSYDDIIRSYFVKLKM